MFESTLRLLRIMATKITYYVVEKILGLKETHKKHLKNAIQKVNNSNK